MWMEDDHRYIHRFIHRKKEYKERTDSGFKKREKMKTKGVPLGHTPHKCRTTTVEKRIIGFNHRNFMPFLFLSVRNKFETI